MYFFYIVDFININIIFVCYFKVFIKFFIKKFNMRRRKTGKYFSFTQRHTSTG